MFNKINMYPLVIILNWALYYKFLEKLSKL